MAIMALVMTTMMTTMMTAMMTAIMVTNTMVIQARGTGGNSGGRGGEIEW